MRCDVVHKVEHGEKQDADTDAATNWIEYTLPGPLTEFSAENIFNAYETGLYYRGLPNKAFYHREVSATSLLSKRFVIAARTVSNKMYG